MAAPSYQGLARKYRPQTFADMVGQENVAQSMANSLTGGRIAHGHILAGPRGVGKTTSARIFAKALNCVNGPTPTPCGVCQHCVAITQGSDMDVIEFDAASNTKVEQMRELLERVVLAPFAARYKVYVIDEVHMLSNSSFNALLKTLEEPPDYVVFIFATTEFEKIPETVRSRCVIHQFRRLSVEDIVTRLRQVAAGEGIEMEEAVAREVFTLIAQASEGGMRDSLVSFDQLLAMTSGKPDAASAQRLLGLASHATLADTVEALRAGDADRLLRIIDDLVNRGRSLERFVKGLTGYLHEIMLIQSNAASDLLSITGEALDRARDIAGKLARPAVFNMLNQLFELEERMKRTTQMRFLIEFTFLRMGVIRPVVPIDELIDRIKALPDAALGAAPSQAPQPRAGEQGSSGTQPARRVAEVPASYDRSRASTGGAGLSAPAFADSAPADDYEPDEADAMAPAAVTTTQPAPIGAGVQAGGRRHNPSTPSISSISSSASSRGALLGLAREELLELLTPNLPDTHQFLGRYLRIAVAMRADETGLWIQWPKDEKLASRTLSKPENKKAIERTLEDLAGRPMELRWDFATSADISPAATAASAPATSAAAPRKPAPLSPAPMALADSDPDTAPISGDDDGFMQALVARAMEMVGGPSAKKNAPGSTSVPAVTERSTREALESNPDLARRARMAKDFFAGAFIDSNGQNLAI